MPLSECSKRTSIDDVHGDGPRNRSSQHCGSDTVPKETPRRIKTMSTQDSPPEMSPFGDSQHELCDTDTSSSLQCNSSEMGRELDQSSCSCPASSARDKVLEDDTRQLIHSFLLDISGVSSSQSSRGHQSRALPTMKRVVEGLIEKHQYLYSGMISKLKLDERGEDMSFMGSVAENLFSDGTRLLAKLS